MINLVYFTLCTLAVIRPGWSLECYREEVFSKRNLVKSKLECRQDQDACATINFEVLISGNREEVRSMDCTRINEDCTNSTCVALENELKKIAGSTQNIVLSKCKASCCSSTLCNSTRNLHSCILVMFSTLSLAVLKIICL